MPPLYDASDSEYEEDHIHHGENDLTSESDIDAYDVEMTLLVDDGDLSDYEDSVIPNEGAPALSSTPFAAMDSDTSRRRVVVEEVEDRDQQRTDTRPSASSRLPGPSSHIEMHAHWHAHPHPHPQPQHSYPHPPPQSQQDPHPPRPQQPDSGIRLPNFPPMPGLRAQGQVEGQGPLPGLRTLFQPLIVEAVAQAGERLRTTQGPSGPATGQGPAMGPGAPIVQVTFDVPMFRVPTDGQTRQQPQAEAGSGVDAQRQANQTFEHERAFAFPPLRHDHPNPAIFNFTQPTPNPVPTATDAMPPMLRQLFEAFDREPTDLPAADGSQLGGAPGWAGFMGLLFGLGLGASHELHREDPARAKRLVKGLEAVNTGLVKRMRKISEGNADGAICAICWDALLEEDAETRSDSGTGVPLWDPTPDRGQPTNPDPNAANDDSAGPEPEPEEPLPKIIALPCSHVFHSACLIPWFSRPKQTTCPTCRFNVDPDNLTYEPVRRPQSSTRQQPQQQTSPPPVSPQQQERQESSPDAVPPLQQPTQPQDGRPLHPNPPPLRRTIFEHTFTIPFPSPAFPFVHPQAGAPFPQPQPGVRQQGSGQQGLFPAPPVMMDPIPPLAFHRALHTFRQVHAHPQNRPQPPQSGAPGQGGPAPPPQPHAPPPLLGQGLQPPPQDGQRNTNGTPRFPGLFQFELPQIVRMPDGTWFWSAPLGGLQSAATTAAAPQAPPRPAAPKRAWIPPPPPGLTLRQRVEQGEREQGLRCDDMSCGLGPSDDDPEPTADLARVVIHSLGDSTSGCGHVFHPACLVSAERVAGWGPETEGERSRAGGLVEVSCPVCRAVGVVPHDDWKNGVQALA
ncbi:hypothetical protein BC827DRAFT_39986 [Russula dissimulans]|nr:hypothetical protein BC827DRAFT_39986 [Russula dissimulans]